MPIKYGEFTIIHSKNINIFTSLTLWLGVEQSPTKESKFVFLFEDGEIYDLEDNLKDFKFYFLNSLFKLPSYFEKDKRFYFYKEPTKKENCESLDFKPLFSSYTKFNHSMNIASYFNCIYYCHKSIEKTDIFGILRTKSNEGMPRFQFAYDSNEFTKEEVIYIINSLLNAKET